MPDYLVWDTSETREDAVSVSASSASEAAEDWGGRLDRDGSYPLAGNGERREVAVEGPGGDLSYYEVWAEPSYYAREIDSPKHQILARCRRDDGFDEAFDAKVQAARHGYAVGAAP